MCVMNLTEISKKLEQRLKLPLPGASAHEPMRATAIENLIPKFEHKLSPKPGGVLLLLYEEEGVIRFPLTKRQEYAGAHSGQVSLPGGKAEAGENTIQTALRECEEEIGIERDTPRVLGVLSDFFVIPSNFIITPVIAVCDTKPVFRPDPREVAKIISGSLLELVGDDSIKRKEIRAAGQFRMMAPYFEIEGEMVWGATAMMINEFRHVLREVLSQD